jgi:predicted permease
MTMKRQMTPGPWYRLSDRSSRFTQIIGRLKPGITLTQAKASLQPLYHATRQMEVNSVPFTRMTEYRRQQFLKGWIDVVPAERGRSFMRERFEKPLIALMCIVGAVLLIACANLAGLLVARASARQKEIAIRLAMGATRGRIVRQLLVESLLLAVTGGIAGLLLATGMTHLLVSVIPQDTTPLALSSAPNWRILGFDIALSLFAGVLFGLAPALQSTRPDVASTLKDQASAVVSGGTVGLRKALVAAQVTLSLVLLIGAGLFVGTLRNLRNTSPGFNMDGLITFNVDPPGNGYSAPRTSQFYREMLQNISALPGVRGATFAIVALLGGDEWDSSITIQGYEPKPGENVGPHMQFVTPDFFPVIGIPVLMGRNFTVNDVEKSQKVAIINEKFAKKFYGTANPVGRRIGMGNNPGVATDITIVGVVKDTKYEGLREEIPIELYRPYEQAGFSLGINAYVRTDRNPEEQYAPVRNTVHKMDAQLPVFGMRTLNEQVDRGLTTERLVASLSTMFGLLATFLAAIGLYGVMAYSVTRRTREIGIRMALGAKSAAVVRMLMAEVLVLAAAGIAIGVPSAWMLGKFVESQLYGVHGRDIATIAGAAVLIALVAGLAGFGPGRRAVRIQPMEALRWE